MGGRPQQKLGEQIICSAFAIVVGFVISIDIDVLLIYSLIFTYMFCSGLTKRLTLVVVLKLLL
jgi:hypothetical protein